MHPFELTTDLETDNPDIDGRPRALFGIANQILFSIELGRDPARFQRAVAALVSLLEYHFASEELAMSQYGYLRWRFHAAFHDHVLGEARNIAERLERDGQIEPARDAIFFLLEDWVVYHVARADRELAEHLREHAAESAARLPEIGPLKHAGKLSANFDERLLAVP